MPGQDVLIVGGGLIGTSIAWRLAQRGAHVTIADASPLGGEASTAAAGMLSPGGEFEAPSPWVDLGVASLRLYPSFVAGLTQETGAALDFRVCGCLHIEANPPESRADFQRRAGIRVERHPEGFFYPDDAVIDPAATLRALRCAVEARGVRTEMRRVTEVNATAHAAVVIAAGAWSGHLRVTYEDRAVQLPPTVPVKGHMIGFEMRPGLLGPFLRHGQTYVVQRSDGFVIAGTTEEHVGFDTRVDAGICAEIHRRAAAIVPELGGAEPVRRWIGFRPGPLDPSGPRAGRIEGTNVWLAYGHYRNGILLAPLTAARVAAEIAAI